MSELDLWTACGHECFVCSRKLFLCFPLWVLLTLSVDSQPTEADKASGFFLEAYSPLFLLVRPVHCLEPWDLLKGDCRAVRDLSPGRNCVPVLLPKAIISGYLVWIWKESFKGAVKGGGVVDSQAQSGGGSLPVRRVSLAILPQW